MMRIIAMAGVMLAATAGHAAPVAYQIDSDHTDIVWQASHFGFSKSVGEFTASKGVLMLDEDNPAATTLEVSIDMNSLQTGSAKFDEHLKSEDFFDVKKYPSAQFKSTGVEITSDRSAMVTGDLTMHGETHPIQVAVTLNKLAVNDFNGKQTAGFSATAPIDRTLWGVSYGTPGIPALVELRIESEATVERP